MRNGLLLVITLVFSAVVIGWASTPVAAQDVSTPDGALFLTIDLQVDPERIDEFLEIMIEAAPDTRNWEGCLLFDIYVDQDNPGRVVFYEIWDSKENQQAYAGWRGETAFNVKIGPYLVAGGGGLTYFNKVDG